MDEYTVKEMFEVIKYFKNIYTLINNLIVQKIYFVGNKFYYKKDQFFVLYGELENDDSNEFLKWIKDKKVLVSLEDIAVAKTEIIRKNIESMIITDDKFMIKYADRDGNDQVFEFTNKEAPKYDDVITTIERIEKQLTYTHALDFNDFEDTIILYVNEDNEAVQAVQPEKIIDFPIKRILSVQSLSKTVKKALGVDYSDEGVTYTLEFSERDINWKRYVKITSKSGYVKINQVFATI